MAVERRRTIGKLREQANKVTEAMERFVEATGDEDEGARRKSVVEAELLEREMEEWESLRKRLEK